MKQSFFLLICMGTIFNVQLRAHTILLNGLKETDPGVLVGIYKDGYPLMSIELQVKAIDLIYAMPDAAVKALASCGLSGSDASMRQQLKKMVREDDKKRDHEKRVYLSASFVDGVEVRKQGAQFNLVMHEALLAWLQRQVGQARTFKAGLFGTDGVEQLADNQAPITLNELTNIEVNPHYDGDKTDVLAYSPDNAKFGVTADRGVVSFWAVSCWEGRILISYQVLLLTQQVKDLFMPMIDEIKKVRPAQKQLDDLVAGLKNFSGKDLVAAEVITPQDAQAFGRVAASLKQLAAPEEVVGAAEVTPFIDASTESKTREAKSGEYKKKSASSKFVYPEA